MPTTSAIVRVDTKLRWQCVRAAGGNWIGICDPLRLTVQAATWAELMEDIGHTLDVMLRDLLSSRELEKFLRDHGWNLLGPIPAHSGKDIRFDVPFIPALMTKHGPQGIVRQ